jgi:hypothetical protein
MALGALLAGSLARPLHGQRLPGEAAADSAAMRARSSVGIRAGTWAVSVQQVVSASRSPHIEVYYQRGIDAHLALENSLAVWRVKTTITQGTPVPTEIVTRTYIAPLLTSLKLYPLSRPGDALEPYAIAGVGFVFGVQDESESAIGGGGTTVVTGFGFRSGLGLEMRLGGALGVAAAGKYQWVHFGEELVNMETFSGLGLEGGLTYRLHF